MGMRVDVREWPCWEIIRCTNVGCRVRSQKAKSCWEIASELDDYRSALNVCSDCIVYIAKQASSPLSEEELEAILGTKRVECVLASKCPNRKEAVEGA